MINKIITLLDTNYHLSFLYNLLCSSSPSSVKKFVSISSSGTKSSMLATAPLPPVVLVTLDGVSEIEPTTVTNHKLLPYKENENAISFHTYSYKPDTQ